MGPRGDTGASLARLRELRSGFNANQLKEASERWSRCRDSAVNDEREHATMARALEVLASRAAEGVRAKGAPSRGGPVRSEVAAVLRAGGTSDAIAAIVASTNTSTARVACKSLDILLSIVSAASATKPSAPLISALANRVAHDETTADATTALSAALALRKLTSSPLTLDDKAVFQAVRASNVCQNFAKRLARFAFQPTPRYAQPIDVIAPAVIALAAFAPRVELWDFLDANTPNETTSAILAQALAWTAEQLARERRFDAAAAALDAAATLAATRCTFRVALCRPESGMAHACGACVRGVGFREADAAPCAATTSAAAAFRALAATAPDLPAPDSEDWKPTIEALVRGVAAHAESVRASTGENADALARRAAATIATVATAALLRPKRWVYGAPSLPPPPWRAVLLSTDIVRALCETTTAWADAGVANRGLTSIAQPGSNNRFGPAHAWSAVERLVIPGETPRVGAEDAATLTHAALATVALVAPPSTRREEVVSSVITAPSERRSRGAPSPLVAGAGAGARDSVAEAAAAAAGRALCALLECDATRAVAALALDETRDLLGGDEWTRCVGRHLSLGVGATPAKACLAAALARLPNGRGALVESGAVTRVAATLVDVVSAAAAAATSRRAEVLGEPDSAVDEYETLDKAHDGRFDILAGFVDDGENLFAPFRWRTGDAPLVAASLRALVELVSPRVENDAHEKSVTSSSSRLKTANASLPAALHSTLAALASEEGAASLGGDASDEIRCWSLLACRCVGADPGVGGVGGAARVAAALLEALPDTFTDSGEGNDVDETAVLSASPIAPPDVCFVLADGTRQPAHAVVLSARCPALLGAYDNVRMESPGLRPVKLGASVTCHALCTILKWAYSGNILLETHSTLDPPDNLSLVKLAAKCGTYELVSLVKEKRPKPGAYVTSLTESLREALREGRFADIEADVAEGPDAILHEMQSVDLSDEQKSSRKPLAHRVILCARVPYFRAALDVRHGFTESERLNETLIKALRFPVSCKESLACLLETLYTGGFDRLDINISNTSITTLVDLAAGLEYLMLPEEAQVCASRVVHLAGGADWREKMGGVSGALQALQVAANKRRWTELKALLGTVAEAYNEATEAGTLWDAIHPELREAMRRTHVQRTRARA